MSNDSGRTKGPIHLVIKTLRECGVEPIAPTVWQVPLAGKVDILAHPDYPTFARQLSVDAIWKELALHRQGYTGLDPGLDYKATLRWPTKIKSVSQRHRMISILQDGVWTPTRASRVGIGSHNCLHCGEPNADVTHLWWECKHLDSALSDADPFGWPFQRLHLLWQRALGEPRCLWRTGTVPKGLSS